MPFLELSDGNKLFYRIEGEGTPVILLNGIMMTAEAWAFQRQNFSKKHTVISHDFLGQGQSSQPAGGYSFELHCEHLIRLMEELDLKEAHLVGASYGGEVGMLFSAEYPERVKSLTVAGSVSEIHPLLEAMGKSWMAAAEMERGEHFLRIVAPLIYSEDFFAQRREWFEGRIKSFSSTVTPRWFKAFNGLMRTFMQLDLTGRLGEIQAPTLVIAGEEDILKPPRYSRIIAENIPDSRLEILKTAHAIPLEDPAGFNQLVGEFMANAEG